MNGKQRRNKELRILFSEDAMARLERQCELLDVPPSTWARALIMEKVTAYEAATANAMMRPVMAMLGDFVGGMTEEMEDYRKRKSEGKLEDSRK